MLSESRPLLPPAGLPTQHSELELDHEPITEAVDDKQARLDVERSLLKKLDRRMSILILIYILNYIDRNNASVARLRGFEEDLGLSDNQFATILSVLYVGYIIMQIPSNMLLHHLGRPSVYLPSCMAVWGVISISTGFTTNFLGALCTRFLLGFVEAAFFPGALFLLSRWYTRSELSQRTALFFSGSLISNGFGTLFASGILNAMDGVWGFAAWRWLFFIEGFMTVVVAIMALFILPDFPENYPGWLTPAEQALAVQRIIEDSGFQDGFPDNIESASLGEDYHKKHPSSTVGFWLALRDWKVWWLSLTMGVIAVSVSFNTYFPTLAATMGYSTTVTLLLCTPPWIFATVITYFVARHSDEQGERCWHIAGPFLIGILGFFIAIATPSIGLRYFALFLMTQSYAGYVCFLAWASESTSQPSSKRAVALGLINSGATIGNIIGPYIWPTVWGPTYSRSYIICSLTTLAAIGMCFMFRGHLAWLNRRCQDRYTYLL